MSRFRAVAVLVFALGLSVAAKAREENDGTEVEGILVPPGIGVRVPPSLAAGSAAANPGIHLAWLDPSCLGEGSAPVAQDEVRRLLGTVGLQVTWRTGRTDELARDGEIRVILVSHGVAQRGTFVLGSTPTQPSDQPFLWVHLPSVRASLGLGPAQPAAMPEPAARYRVGTALGRVIAHEVVHVLAPGVPHGRGLMASRLTGRDLTASRIPIDPEVGVAVRAALAGAALPHEPGEGQLALHGGQVPAAADSTTKEVP